MIHQAGQQGSNVFSFLSLCPAGRSLLHLVRFQVLGVMSAKMAVSWDVAAGTLVDSPDDGDSSPETSVIIYLTSQHNIPQDSHLHITLLCAQLT
jgi:hypothetical protein